MNKIKKIKLAVFLLLGLIVSGCSYKAYMDLHGASIRSYPEIHAEVTQDEQCLECHHPDTAEGPETPHPDFKGCIKCHNDEIS